MPLTDLLSLDAGGECSSSHRETDEALFEACPSLIRNLPAGLIFAGVEYSFTRKPLFVVVFPIKLTTAS